MNRKGNKMSEGKAPSKKGLWKPAVLILIIAAIMVTAHLTGVGKRLENLKGWINGLGPAGYAVFGGIYIAATVFALPGSVLTLMAGAMYGTVVGTVLASIASTVGAGLCFLIARYIARKSIEASLNQNEKFRKLDALTLRKGAVIVAITRLVPVFPFNLLNYGFGLTKISFPVYLFTSWLCMLPATIVYVGIGDAVSKGAEGSVPWGALITVSVVILLMIMIVPIARKKLKKTEEAQGETDV